MRASKSPLLTRWDVAFIVVVAIGAAPFILSALAPKPSGWLLVGDLLLSALLGLLIAAVFGCVIRLFYWIAGWPWR
jgi:hypothetical protein